MFFWAPTGVNLNLCVAGSGNGRVVLRICDGLVIDLDSAITDPVASTGFYTWTNRRHAQLTVQVRAPRARSWSVTARLQLRLRQPPWNSARWP